MKVTHLNTLAEGGATKAALRLHDGLARSGVESLFVRVKKGRAHAGVIEIPQPIVPDLLTRCLRRMDRWAAERRLRRRRFSTYASEPRTPFGPVDLEGLRTPDIFNLHWVAGFLDWPSMLPWMATRAPLVWTLHDMNPLLGIWHYAPQPDDWTGAVRRWDQRVMQLKQRVLDSLPDKKLTIVGPSKWICEEARNSHLTRRFDVRHIPYGVDTGVFRPIEKQIARRVLGLPVDVPVVGFAADYLTDRRKGGHLVVKALEMVRTPGVVSLLVGSLPQSFQAPPGTVHLGRVESELLMALFYSALDVFVCPSLQDNLPNTVLESLACGTPVIGSRAGGIPDMVRPGATGWLVRPEDAGELAEAFDDAFSNPGRIAMMSERCREVALRDYALPVQAAAYADLYETLRRAGPLPEAE